MNIFQKLVEVRKQVKSLTKDAQGYGYKYSSGALVLSSIRDKMDELGILLSPEIVEQSKQQVLVKVWNKETKTMVEKIEWVVELKINYTWINAEKPEDKYAVTFSGFGQQADPAQAFGSALTYSERYFVLKYFQIPTDDLDPDNQKNGRTQTVNAIKKKSCPLCNVEDKVIESKYPDKGKYYCLECKQSFDSFGRNDSDQQSFAKTPEFGQEIPRTSKQGTKADISPQYAESARIKFVNYAKKVFADQLPAPMPEALENYLLKADKTVDDQRALLKWFSHYICEGDKKRINEKLLAWSIGRGHSAFGLFELDRVDEKEIIFTYSKAKKDFKNWIENLDGKAEPPTSLTDLAESAGKKSPGKPE